MIFERVKIDPKTGCWLWQGQRQLKYKPNGGLDSDYGILTVGGKNLRAHRVSYEIYKGPIPSGLMVRHKCDNPPCVNPAHLEVGTAKDNARDAVERGRTRRGEKNRNAKLSESEMLEIRNSDEAGIVLAQRYGVTPPTISKIRLGKIWKHCEGNGKRKLRRLSEDVIRDIKFSDKTAKELRELYGVTSGLVSGVRSGKRHKNVTA